MTQTAVIIFPASNCDTDAVRALTRLTGKEPTQIWHQDKTMPEKLDLIVVPGGFSYGDYLRAGAIAARSPIMPALRRAAKQGRTVIGICNGFQILTEAKLLPGALAPNASGQFICRPQRLKIEHRNSWFTRGYEESEQPILPIAHGEGRYVASPATLTKLKAEGQILFRYCDNPNGSAEDIAGICSRAGNVLGMMPHPERAADSAMGRTDGMAIFQSALG